MVNSSNLPSVRRQRNQSPPIALCTGSRLPSSLWTLYSLYTLYISTWPWSHTHYQYSHGNNHVIRHTHCPMSVIWVMIICLFAKMNVKETVGTDSTHLLLTLVINHIIMSQHHLWLIDSRLIIPSAWNQFLLMPLCCFINGVAQPMDVSELITK